MVPSRQVAEDLPLEVFEVLLECLQRIEVFPPLRFRQFRDAPFKLKDRLLEVEPRVLHLSHLCLLHHVDDSQNSKVESQRSKEATASR